MRHAGHRCPPADADGIVDTCAPLRTGQGDPGPRGRRGASSAVIPSQEFRGARGSL